MYWVSFVREEIDFMRNLLTYLCQLNLSVTHTLRVCAKP